jgi:hypothetical protein
MAMPVAVQTLIEEAKQPLGADQLPSGGTGAAIRRPTPLFRGQPILPGKDVDRPCGAKIRTDRAETTNSVRLGDDASLVGVPAAAMPNAAFLRKDFAFMVDW